MDYTASDDQRLFVSMRTETYRQILGSIVRLIDEGGEVAPLARTALIKSQIDIERKWPGKFRNCAFVAGEIERLETRLGELKEIQSRCS